MRSLVRFRILIVVLGLCALPAIARADGSATFGTQWWDQTSPEAKYQEFGDIPNGPLIESFMVRDKLWSGKYTIVGSNLLRHDQSSLVAYRTPRWRASVEYTQTPHNFSFISRTPYTQTVQGNLALPDTLQAKNQASSASFTQVMTDLMNNTGVTPLGFRTDLTKVRLKGRPAAGIAFDLKGSKRQRSGNKAYGGTFGFSSAIEIPEPINQTMAQADARLSYTHKRLSIEATGGLSAFTNNVDALVWDNPRRVTDSPTAGAESGRLDLYPDNKTVQGGLQVGVQLPRRTTFTGSVMVSQTTQDDTWLPFTINSAILQPDSFPLPGTNTEGKANTLTQDYRLTSRPSNYVSGTLRFRRSEFDNKTESHTFAGSVTYDQTWNGTDITNHPFGNTVTNYGLDLDVKPITKVTVTFLAEQQRRDRTFREVTRDDETTLGVKAHVRPVKNLDATASYRHAKRELDEFHIEDYENDAGALIEQPGLRRYDVGDRKQERGNGSLGWSPTGKIDLSATYDYLRNEYESDSELEKLASPTHLGLLDEVRRSASLQGAIHLSERMDVTAGYGWGQVYTNQRSRESGATLAQVDSVNWQARLKDWFIYLSGGVEWRPITDKLTIGATYLLERAPGVFRLTRVTGTAIDLPGTRYKREGVGTEAWYQVDESLSLGVRWGWEQYEATDFANKDVPLLFPSTGAVTAIFMGDSFQDYRANQVELRIRRTF